MTEEAAVSYSLDFSALLFVLTEYLKQQDSSFTTCNVKVFDDDGNEVEDYVVVIEGNKPLGVTK